VLHETGNDPAWIAGGSCPSPAATWCRLGLAGRRRRRVRLPGARIAPAARRRLAELDHHAAYGSTAELQETIDAWLAGVPDVVRGWELEPVDFGLAVPGDHNRRNAAAALEALTLVGVDRTEAEAALGRFEGTDRRFQLVGERGGVTVIDDYGHNPTELRAALETARAETAHASGRLVALYVPHVVERTRHLHSELGEALGLADVAIVTDFVGRRDAPREGVTGRLVLDAVPDPTRRVWAPTLDDAAFLALRIVRPGDVVLTLGVGEPWRAARAIVEGLSGLPGEG
jgi:UDP-N-acetylmuramate-alanine ligase